MFCLDLNNNNNEMIIKAGRVVEVSSEGSTFSVPGTVLRLFHTCSNPFAPFSILGGIGTIVAVPILQTEKLRRSRLSGEVIQLSSSQYVKPRLSGRFSLLPGTFTW